jgi:acetoin utilization protein AcuB
MRLSDIMSKNVATTPPDRAASELRAEMKRRSIHHMLVVDDGRVIGVVSERDLGSARAIGDRTAVDVMTGVVVSAGPDTTVRQAANLLRGRSIGCLPIFDGEALVGIVTTTDLLSLIGQGVERPVARSTRWTLGRRQPRTGGAPP